MPSSSFVSPIAGVEARLRNLLPSDLYAAVWLDPSTTTLNRVFEHLRTLQRILGDYIARQVLEQLPKPGEIRYEWQEGTLMFTDLAGFTPLMEANSGKGAAGAQNLLRVLNNYFAGMIEIISKSGGNVLEFTGDAMLAQFPSDGKGRDAGRAVRAGLRMQRAMASLGKVQTDSGELTLGMRVGIHSGRFLTAEIGTPKRMDHVLLGSAVRMTKRSEGAGTVGRVCLTAQFQKRVATDFHTEPTKEDHFLVIDDLSTSQLGEFDLSVSSRKISGIPLLDRSLEGLLGSINEALERVEPMAGYLPTPILNLLVESATTRVVRPDFPNATVIFVNLMGLSEIADEIPSGEELPLITDFSRAFTLINATVEAHGGFLKKVTYHLSGSDIMIIFGAPQSHTDDLLRAANAALSIRDIIATLQLSDIGGKAIRPACKIGLATGPSFAGEIGEPRGRREFNVLGDTVNTSARLMSKATDNQILISDIVYQQLGTAFDYEALGVIPLKGKSQAMPIYALKKK
ncbi:MAG TPA: adenylate/guanylate cyclase domain-containing protein [Aggregatilineales bacterium]|nr:adenylate/guanylate cyclase domain-containing protein [Aggregatilineales bacterium]